MVLELLILAPCGLLIAAAYLAVQYRRRPSVLAAALGAAAGAIAFAWAYLAMIFRNTSSTAALGIFTVPIAALAGACVGAAAGWSVHALARFVRGPHRATGGVRLPAIQALAAALTLAVFVYALFAVVSQGVEFSRIQSGALSPAQLDERAATALERADYLSLSAIAANPRTASATLLAIASYPDPGLHHKRGGWRQVFDRDSLAVMRKVLRNPNVPAEAVAALARSTDEYVAADAAASRHLDAGALAEILARFPKSPLVHMGIASNPRSPAPMLEALAGDGFEYTAVALAANPSSPAKLLESLAAHPSDLVRGRAAMNTATDAGTLSTLSRDGAESVRRLLTNNPSVSRELLQRMATEDPSAQVRAAAIQRLSGR